MHLRETIGIKTSLNRGARKEIEDVSLEIHDIETGEATTIHSKYELLMSLERDGWFSRVGGKH